VNLKKLSEFLVNYFPLKMFPASDPSEVKNGRKMKQFGTDPSAFGINEIHF